MNTDIYQSYQSDFSSPSVTSVLIGLESSGKSALFRGITGQNTGEEANFRGSTVQCRRAYLKQADVEIIDTPGIRFEDDSKTTQLTLKQLQSADVVVLVARATHAKSEIELLLNQLKADLNEHKTVLVITFADKAPNEIQNLIEFYRTRFSLPIMLINARQIDSVQRTELINLTRNASKIKVSTSLQKAPDIPVVQPKETLYEHKGLGPFLSIISMLLLFGLPVYIAYIFASWLQPIADKIVIEPLTTFISQSSLLDIINVLLVGKYGVITLGWYSFLWAFPVVVLISISVALTEEMGLKDRITAALDPWLKTIGLNGRDLLPVLTGFGCNVVAILQSRSCSFCTRKNCISLIAFGSACSYQIGASLSLFSVGGKPWLFIPYLTTLFIVGAIHTRVWNTNLLLYKNNLSLSERSFLQMPSMQAVWWRIRGTLKQFLFQAMPIFLFICLIGAILEYLGILNILSNICSPLLKIIGLPSEVATGIIFSVVRKDGLLVLNQDNGELITSLTTGQLFILVYFASTLTACLVTLFTIRKELGLKYALNVFTKQALSSVVSTLIISLIFRLI